MTAANFLLFVIILKASQGVRIRGVEVPKEVQAGEDVQLRCRVDPWPGPLYSLSWWKDGAQFYRAAVTAIPASRNDTPSSGSVGTVFPQAGLSVKAGRLGLGHVVLQAVTVAASGNYSCEAVADFPSFSQHLVSASLTVVDPPDTKPVLSGFRVRYRPGEQLTANCTVLRAYPLPTLTWFINGKVVNGTQKVVEVVPEEDLTLTLTGRISLRLRRSHFVDSVFYLGCGARVGESIWTSTTITGYLATGNLQTYLGVGGDTHDDHPPPILSLHAGQAAVQGCSHLSLLFPLVHLLLSASCREGGSILLW